MSQNLIEVIENFFRKKRKLTPEYKEKLKQIEDEAYMKAAEDLAKAKGKADAQKDFIGR